MEGSHEGAIHGNGDPAPQNNDNDNEDRNIYVNVQPPMEEFAAENLENERISRENLENRNEGTYQQDAQNREAYWQNLHNERIHLSHIQTVDNSDQEMEVDGSKGETSGDQCTQSNSSESIAGPPSREQEPQLEAGSPSETNKLHSNFEKNCEGAAEKEEPSAAVKLKMDSVPDEVLPSNLTTELNTVIDEKATNGSSNITNENEDSQSNLNENAPTVIDSSIDINGSSKYDKEDVKMENDEVTVNGTLNEDNDSCKANENKINTDAEKSPENVTNINGSLDSEIINTEIKTEEENCNENNLSINGSPEIKTVTEDLASKITSSVLNMNGDAKNHSPASGELMERVIIISKSELKEAIIPITNTRGERSGSEDGKSKSPSKNNESRSKSYPKRSEENSKITPAKREHRRVTFDSPSKSDAKPGSSSSKKNDSRPESKEAGSSSVKSEKPKCEVAADSTTKKNEEQSSHSKGHHSSRRSSRDHHSSHRKHSSHCRSLKDGEKCDCRKRHHNDRDRHDSHRSDREKTDSRRSHRDRDDKESHRSSHSSKHSRKHDRLNFKQQVNISELHNHCIKQTKTEPKTGEAAYRLHPRVPWTPHETIAKFKHQELFRIETDVNGGATTCHLYYDEISHLPEDVIKEIAEEFIMLSYSEDENENAHHVMGIVHGGADYLPDLLDYMADHYPTITVKTGSLTGRATQSITMGQYRDEAYRTYSNGTFRYAPLQELSICGVQGEEVGAYFPDFVKRLEKSCHMLPVMPWSYFSVVSTDNPRESNDGPIFWIRPGEQTLPSSDASRQKGRLAKGVSRLSEAREALFEDRTKPHADQIGVDGGSTDTAPTAAVGLLKAVNCGHADHGGRATKDVVAFHAEDYNSLLDILQIDVYEPPLRQCTMWLETAKLNSLRRQGVRYSRRQLHDGDVYYLPRKVIHQFQTISSVASVAWHVRFLEYFKTTGAPNLHAPTGLNKGAVYYEKTEVPPYNPPKPEEPEEEVLLVKTPKKRRRRSEGDGKNEVKKKIKKEKVEEKKKKPPPSPKVPTIVIKPVQPSGSRDVPKPVVEKVPISEGEKDLKQSEPVKKDAHIVSPIKLEKSGNNSFCVVNKPTETASPKKLLRQNMPFKKRKTEKVEESCDVLGDIMSQMKKSKTD